MAPPERTVAKNKIKTTLSFFGEKQPPQEHENPATGYSSVSRHDPSSTHRTVQGNEPWRVRVRGLIENIDETKKRKSKESSPARAAKQPRLRSSLGEISVNERSSHAVNTGLDSMSVSPASLSSDVQMGGAFEKYGGDVRDDTTLMEVDEQEVISYVLEELAIGIFGNDMRGDSSPALARPTSFDTNTLTPGARRMFLDIITAWGCMKLWDESKIGPQCMNYAFRSNESKARDFKTVNDLKKYFVEDLGATPSEKSFFKTYDSKIGNGTGLHQGKKLWDQWTHMQVSIPNAYGVPPALLCDGLIFLKAAKENKNKKPQLALFLQDSTIYHSSVFLFALMGRTKEFFARVHGRKDIWYNVAKKKCLAAYIKAVDVKAANSKEVDARVNEAMAWFEEIQRAFHAVK